MSDIVTGGDGAAPGTPFKGNFDGGNHTVDLNINSELAGAGLFGYTDHAVISDLRLTGSVYGYSHVGALMGYAFGGSVSGVYSAAEVTSPGHDVGGVIGTFYERASDYARSSVSRVFFVGEVKYSSAGVDLTDEADVNLEWNELGMVSDAIGVRFGGIVGSGISLRLSSAFNTGSVTALRSGRIGRYSQIHGYLQDGRFSDYGIVQCRTRYVHRRTLYGVELSDCRRRYGDDTVYHRFHRRSSGPACGCV